MVAGSRRACPSTTARTPALNGSLFKRCSCSTLTADADGRAKRQDLSTSCPRLRRADGAWNTKHGTWFFRIEFTRPGDVDRAIVRHGGYLSRKSAEEAMNDIAALVAIADQADNPAKTRTVIIDMVRTQLKANLPLPDADQVRARTRVGQILDADVTVEQWLRRWLASKTDLRRATQLNYAAVIDNHLIPALGEHQLNRLRPSHIREAMALIAEDARQTAAANAKRHTVLAASKQAWRDHDAAAARAARAQLAEMPPFRRPPGPVTIQRIRAVLRSALTDATYEQLITVNPAKLVKLPSGKTPKALIWTPARIKAWQDTGVKPGPVMVWTAAQTAVFLRRATKHQLYALYLLIAHCGLRRGEACGLRWQDLDLGNNTMAIKQQIVQVGWVTDIGDTKTDSGERTIALSKIVVKALRDRELDQARDKRDHGATWTDTGLVFTRRDGTALQPARVTDHFTGLAREAGLPPVRLHDMRHGTATHLLTAGIEMKVVSEILGHSSTVITADLYTSVVDDLKHAAAIAIADTFSAPHRNRTA